MQASRPCEGKANAMAIMHKDFQRAVVVRALVDRAFARTLLASTAC